MFSNAYVISGEKWGDPEFGSGAIVSWSYMDTGLSCNGTYESIGCSVTSLADFMPLGFENEIERSFDAWSDIAGLTFIQVPDSGDAFNAHGSSGDIRLGGHSFDGPGGILAHGYLPQPGSSAAGDIHFDSGDLWTTSFGTPGFDIFQVFTHELGHALGLDHTNVPRSLMNPYYTQAFSGPQADDFAGIQYLYGLPAAGNEVPEPASVFLLMIGLLGLIAVRKRHKVVSDA
ncbi:matrix metalloproteinase-15 [Neptunomonas japonica JAMM 1380]|uniref:Matrix metalloproteinase-15 n=2 Tax=Neptunomonas TaxID=75687 RepID=A0A7R6PMZ6_9GAMM|nr:matrix metalloproteinase-15 [Neptunomonas japonica JAMM 1380]